VRSPTPSTQHGSDLRITFTGTCVGPASLPACRRKLLVDPGPGERQRRQGPIGSSVFRHYGETLSWDSRALRVVRSPARSTQHESDLGYHPVIPSVRLWGSDFESAMQGSNSLVGADTAQTSIFAAQRRRPHCPRGRVPLRAISGLCLAISNTPKAASSECDQSRVERSLTRSCRARS
jgi:hypothetical protein